MLVRWLFLLILFFSTHSVFAIQITVQGMPEDYVIYQWISSNRVAEALPLRSNRYSTYTMDIPNDHIVYAEDGAIDILATLTKWRRDTPLGYGFPFTPGGRPPRYPFRPNDGSLAINQQAYHYISIGHILRRVEDYPNLRFGASTGETVDVLRSGFIDEMEGFKNGEPLDCTKPKGLGARDPTWTEAECNISNCVNEAGIKDNRGKVAVNQVVLRRVVHKSFPNSICDVVLFKKWNPRREKVEAAFSWAFGGSLMTFKGYPHSSYNA